MLKLATNLHLPASAITETAAFFGTRGTGKTYGCGKFVEEAHDAGAQVVVVDPVGVWYGLRLDARGRGAGLAIPVFGGLHGDVPLEPTAGKLVAELIVGKRLSAVLDVSMFTLGEQHRFVSTFATALFNLKKADRGPLHVVFDEAHEFLPQMVQGNEAEMVGAVRRLSKMGRNFGIGVSLISPRPAEVNKGSVNLTERMYCGRLKGPQDRKAIEAWASSNDADASVLDQLPQLPNGDLIAWTAKGPERVRFLPKRTFDASKTPEAGDAKPAAKLPDINLAEIRTAMAATIEEAKANDPKVLKAKVDDLERQLLKATIVPFKRLPPEAKRVEVSVLLPKDRQRLDAIAKKFGAALVRSQDIGHALVNEIAALNMLLHKQAAPAAVVAGRHEAPGGNGAAHAPAWTKAANQQFHQKVASQEIGVGSKMPISCRRMLSALAQHGPLGRRKLAILTGYATGGSTMRSALATLRKECWAEDIGTMLNITDLGRRDLGPVDALPTGLALRQQWLGQLSVAPRRFLEALIGVYPDAMLKIELAESVSRDGQGEAYAAGGSTMRSALATLRGLELVNDEGRDALRAAADLFA